jgi:hypothetical protein
LAIVFDKNDRIIMVESPATSVTIQTLINAIRDYEDEPEAMDIASIATASGKEDLGGGTLIGITLKLINWKLKFEDRLGPTYILCDVLGGNLVATDENGASVNPIEPATYVMVTKTASVSATISEEIKSDVAQLKKIGNNRWRILNNQMIIYDTDGITPLRTFDLKDKDGNATEQNVYERVPV